MLNIAICDDDATDRAKTRTLLDGFLATRGIAAEVWEFAASKELLFAVTDAPFDLYLLDVVMPEMDGIELGITLRKTDRDGAIIYLTTSEDFAVRSYAARAFYYLVKPISADALYPVLDEAFAGLKYREEASIQIRTQDGVMRLQFDEIYYVELTDRRLRYVYRGGIAESTNSSAPLQERVAPLLEDKRFCVCGASLVLNLQHIKTVDKTSAIFGSGERLEIPRRAASEFRTAWKQYLGNCETNCQDATNKIEIISFGFF